MAGWFVGSAWSAQPYYYDYGSGGNVYYEDNSVYVDGNEYCSTEEYYQEAEAIASQVPEYTEQQGEEMEWMPLGVWALTTEDVTETNRLLQIAVNKDGVIAGTYFNETTETQIPVEGAVDSKTQRVAMRLVDEKNGHIVLETGIYNLTEDTAPALLHHGAEKTGNILMVRLDKPEDEAESSTDQ